ncbi:hypothetical protein HDE_11604 [Halotydeus destructor]|nr:hypothetical protein HDE_11604 [Halotydeus destructor]
MYGLLQRNEADVSFLPLPLPNEDDVAILGPVVLEDKIRFVSRAILSTAKVNMVRQLFNFSLQCTSAFILTYLVLCVMIRVTNHVKMSLQETTWRIYEGVLQGMSCYSKHLSARVLSLGLTLGIMFLVYIWSNTITTAMLTVNTNQVVSEIADIHRLRKTVLALARDPMMNKFKRSKTKMAELYRKLNVVEIRRRHFQDTGSLVSAYEANGVFFSGELFTELYISSVCALSEYRFTDNYSPASDYGSWPWAHLIRRSADYELLRLTRGRISILTENGLLKIWFSKTITMVEKFLPAFAKHQRCLIDNLDQYISDTMMSQDSANGLELQSQESVFLLFTTMLALATIALFSEFIKRFVIKKKCPRNLRKLLETILHKLRITI